MNSAAANNTSANTSSSHSPPRKRTHQDAQESSSTVSNTSSRLPLLRAKRRVELRAAHAAASMSPTNDTAPSPVDYHRQPSFGGVGVASVTDRYEKLSRIGRGSYGTVYKARDLETNRIVALKRCVLWKPKHSRNRNRHQPNAATTTATTAENHQDREPVMMEQRADCDVSVVTLREIETLRLCATCPYIVSLLDVAVSSSSLFLVLDYCDYDLADLIDAHYQQHQCSPFTEAAGKTLLIHLLSALSFLHEHYIMHRDVKMSNLLYSTTQGRLQLADFGLSRHYCDSPKPATSLYDPALTPKVASLWYRPPEVLLACPTYSCAMDIWAAGCVWIELLTGQPAMAGTTELEQIQLLWDAIGMPDQPRDFPLLANGTVQLPTANAPSIAMQGGAYSVSSRRKFRILDRVPFLADSGSQLLVSMLQIAPSQRWTAKQALRSPYFTEHPLPLPERQMPRLFSTATAS
jgi:cyclin-dependent kinase 10